MGAGLRGAGPATAARAPSGPEASSPDLVPGEQLVESHAAGGGRTVRPDDGGAGQVRLARPAHLHDDQVRPRGGHAVQEVQAPTDSGAARGPAPRPARSPTWWRTSAVVDVSRTSTIARPASTAPSIGSPHGTSPTAMLARVSTR